MESTPPVLVGVCNLLFSALALVVSHRWQVNSTECAYFSVRLHTYYQGLPWSAAVPSGRKPSSRRRERRLARVGPEVETAQS